MIVNSNKFRTIVITKRNLQNNPASLSIYQQHDNKVYKDSVELLGVTTDDKLTYKKHINKLYRWASWQLNVIFRLKSF